MREFQTGMLAGAATATIGALFKAQKGTLGPCSETVLQLIVLEARQPGVRERGRQVVGVRLARGEEEHGQRSPARRPSSHRAMRRTRRAVASTSVMRLSSRSRLSTSRTSTKICVSRKARNSTFRNYVA